MVTKKPYFMTDKTWYYYDDKELCLKLTDKAPKEAVESYKKFYEAINGKG